MRAKCLGSNQFALEEKGVDYFLSYESICAKVETKCVGMEKKKSDYTDKEVEVPVISKVLTFGKNWNYSGTTFKFLKRWLEIYCSKYSKMSKKDFEKAILNGEIEVDYSL